MTPVVKINETEVKNLILKNSDIFGTTTSILLSLQFRQRYVIAYGKETDETGGEERCAGCDFDRHTKFVQSPIHQTADNTGYGVDFLLEDDRLVV